MLDNINIQPLPHHQGVGFFTLQKIDSENYRNMLDAGWHIQHVGRYLNFHVSRRVWEWPKKPVQITSPTVDGFSPNLNKHLHVGHLRNLALGASLVRATRGNGVALLGASLGVSQTALDEYYGWLALAGYDPELYYDVLMPVDVIPTLPGVGKQEGCQVVEGTNGSVIVEKSDGKKTYAFHDLVFAKTVSPTHYVTGSEQKDHFKNLGLGDKHLPMGLVLGEDNKKIKSRDGKDALLAEEAIELVMEQLRDTPNPRKLAWNILAWNFLSASRTKNVKFNPKEWASRDKPGLYISYTNARIRKALDQELIPTNFIDRDFTDDDAQLAGFASYFSYYLNQCRQMMDVYPIAIFANKLAMRLNDAYHSERIIGGRRAFVSSVNYALLKLQKCMSILTMHDINQV